MKHLIRRFFSILLFLAALIAIGCSASSESDRIREWVDSLREKFEKRDLPGAMTSFSSDYRDDESRNKSATQAMIADYFGRYRGIVIHLLNTEIPALTNQTASVQIELAVSSGIAETFRKLFTRFGECYRVRLELVKSGKSWQISYAQWESVTNESLSPESGEMLKKLFPESDGSP